MCLVSSDIQLPLLLLLLHLKAWISGYVLRSYCRIAITMLPKVHNLTLDVPFCNFHRGSYI